jgi:hypothetical protein
MLCFAAASAHAVPIDARFNPSDFTSLGILNLSSGTTTFNTDTLTVSGFPGLGVLANTQSGTPVAVFTFSDIDLLSGATINFTGSRPIALLSKTDITIGTTLDVSGASGLANTSIAAGRLGGFAGGQAQVQTTDAANGVGRGLRGDLPSFHAGGGAGSGGGGGRGGAYYNPPGPAGGITYGNAGVTDLLGGSGGAGSAGVLGGNIQNSGGGAGGGAIELSAVGSILIQPTGQILADGGAGGPGNTGGGGGGGGSILLVARDSFTNQGLVSASGGAGKGIAVGGGGGGGGRVGIYYGPDGLVPGTIQASGGAGAGTGGQTAGVSGTSGTLSLASEGTWDRIHQGQVAYWPLEDGTGSPSAQTVQDLAWAGSVADNGTRGPTTAVESSDPTWASGKVGGALSFDGNDYVLVPDSPDLRPQALTISYWIKPTLLGPLQDFISKRNAANTSGLVFEELETGVIAHYFRINDTWPSVNIASTQNQWQHVVVTWQSGDPIMAWLNGGMNGTPTSQSGIISGTITYDATSFYLGVNSMNLGRGFQGQLDEVEIWNRVLTADEIAFLYNQGAGRTLLPEPATLTLLALGGLAGLLRRRSRR